MATPNQEASGAKDLPRCLFVCHYHEPLRSTILPLCRALKVTGVLDPVVAVEGDVEGRMQAMCEAEEVACVSLRRRKDSVKRPRVPSTAPVRPDSAQAQSNAGRRRGVLRLLGRIAPAVVSYRAKIWRLGAVLRKLQPAVLVTLDDRTVMACRWIRAAQRRKMPVIVVQWAAFHRAETLIDVRHAQTGRGHLTPAVRLLEDVIARRVHLASHQLEGERIWWIPPHNTLALWCNGAYPRTNPWAFGGGNSDVTAVFGEEWKQRLLQDGVPPSKLLVTGHPEQDKWYHLRQSWTPQDTDWVKRDLGIPSDREIVTIIAPALAFRQPGGCRQGDSSFEEIREDLRFVLHAVLQLGRPYVPVVKAHPRDSEDDFAYLNQTDNDKIYVTRDYPVERLLAASRLMTCQWSTTVLLACALRVPVLVFDFHNSPSAAMWNSVVGVDHAGCHEHFAAQLRACLLDEAVRQKLRREGDEFVDRYLKLDGQATQRLVALIGQRARSYTSSATRRRA